ncbi:zinc finger protein 85-like isoform X2 [Pomacea canaliculata]|uniref:zinc finger protein 85-like isoform X2 n=1 Tax=Pomacea canaliculata TaxID=400727 RepID=UPI000D72B0C3|nr:zinc finger protein 85-like isoform X2 [Pomacea canaliculata]
MSAIKNEMQSPCTLIKTETTSVADALEDLTVNVIPKAESSFCFDYNETKCLQIGFMQHDNSFGQKLHDIKIDPADQKHWRCENVPKSETNSQMSSSFVKIEWQPAHIVKTECMTENNHRVKIERALPGQEEVCQPNSDNEFYCNTYEVKTQYGLHHDENTNGPVTSEVKHEDHSGQEVGSIVKAEPTKSHSLYKEGWNIQVATMMEHLKAQSAPQEMGYSCRVKIERALPGQEVVCHPNSEFYCNCQGITYEVKTQYGLHHDENANGPVTSEVKHEDHSGQEVGSIVNAELTKSHSLYKEGWNIKVATMMKHMQAQSAPQEVGYSCRKNKDILPFLSSPEQVVSGGKHTELMDITTESPQHETNLNVTEPSVNFKSEEQRHSKNTKSYECKVCMSSFSFPSLLKKHMSIHIGKLHKCRECEAAFKSLYLLKRHMIVHSDQKPHKCKLCKASFKRLGTLKQHMLVHSDEKPHKCRVCEVAFRRLDVLKQHMLVHKNEKPHHCRICKAAFKTLGNLKQHMLVHSDEKPQKCRVCEAAFKTLARLKQHMQVHSNEGPHKCRVCKASFKTLGNLNWHMKVHSNEKPHKCRVCEAAFKRLGTLKQHMLVHSNKKPHQCSVCKAAFKFSYNLKNHMLVHSKDKPHKCSVCEGAFKTSARLKQHMQVHSKEKPYQCSVCKAAFKLSYVLKRHHMRVHSDEKPHICRVCKASFKKLGILKRHMHVHSDKKVHQCSVCKDAFKTVYHFKLHMQNHSNEETSPVQHVEVFTSFHKAHSNQ